MCHPYSLSDTLERLNHFVSALDKVFPAVQKPVGTIRFPVHYTRNENYSESLQPFVNINEVGEGYEIGRSTTFGCLAPLLLAATIQKSDALDFKAYCCNFGNGKESFILTTRHIRHNTDYLQQLIALWADKCDLHSCRTDVPVRRCVVIDFVTLFHTHGANKESTYATEPNFIGHCITIALELNKRELTLSIYDYRLDEYVYNVHDQLFKFMSDSVEKYSSLYDKLNFRTVCLKKRLHVDLLFMTCMSAAFRVCVYLSNTGEVHESKQDFVEDSLNLKNSISRMIDWFKDYPGIRDNTYTPLISPEMAKDVFEINSENCYFLLAPYDMASDLFRRKQNAWAEIEAVDKACTKQIRYSLKDGFKVTRRQAQNTEHTLSPGMPIRP